MIEVRSLSKDFHVHRKQEGLWGSLRSLVRRETVVKHAVREATFHVGEGEILGLVGANGAGKTTLVKMLAGIIHPSSGEARVLGHKPWERARDFQRRIALIMGQKAQLWWDLPAADCFLLLKEIYQIPERQYRETLAFLSETLQVKGELHIQIRRLSLGERMKMELIAALLHRPRVVFLDEPTIGLDLSAQRAIRDFILDYRQLHRPAMLLTSHYMEDIERLCARILIIREGELVFDGPLAEVMRTHARHKVVAVQLKPGAPPPDLRRLLGRGLDLEVLEEGPERLRIQAPRDEIPSLAGRLVTELAVHDLAIEEMDIGTVIEGLLHARRAQGDLPAAESPPAVEAA
ncbi:MAG: ATP-binding cassette domain-containing protein [bacterium]|jgi:ABC-2 type transport system ATP-binding protein|nr:ATP-binding cassette domain-containing protein [bacterium]